MKRILGVLILTGIVLAFAMATGFSLFTRLFYVLILAVALGYVWAWLNLMWLEVQVDRRTSRISVGQQLVERITVRNRGWTPKPWVEVMELTNLRGHHAGRTISLPAKGFRSWRTATRATRRGVYYWGPLRIATGDPFGLFRLERFRSESQQVLVLPATVPLSHFVILSSDMQSDGAKHQRSYQVATDAASVREYMPGDSVSRVHWPSSARLGSLMVKEFDIGLASDIWILLDLEGSVQADDEEDSTDELAVTAAASIARHFLDQRLRVGLAVNGEELALLPPDRGHIQDARILDLLARAKAEGTTPLVDAIANLDLSLENGATLVIITPSPNDRWVSALGTLAHRNIRLAVVLVDGVTFGGDRSPELLLPALAGLGIPGYLVGKGDNLANALDHPSSAKWDGYARAAETPNLARKGTPSWPSE